MTEVLVSTILEQLGSILRQQIGEEVKLVVGVDDEVRKLTSNFQAIEAVLDDAESKQVKDNAVRDWLDKLKNVSYDIDDVLEEWNTAIQKFQVTGAENASKPSGKVSSFIRCLNCRPFIKRRDIAFKIKSLNKTLDDIAVEKDRFNFSPIRAIGELERQVTTSVVDVAEIHGRNHEKNDIISLLLSESSNGSESLPIISIVGMGGIGKTTLARLVFNDDLVNAHFDKRIWVCVSDPFEEIRIAKAILESFKGIAPNIVEYENVLEQVRQSIRGVKFLLVLDDVWTEDYSKWEQLKNSLKGGSLGSRILVTTRKKNVAEVLGTTKMYQLGTLSNEKCWSLFSQVALSGRSNNECEKFIDIGRKIVSKCKGLPLAVKTLGSLLHFKRKLEEWQKVLDSEMWEIEEVGKGLFPPLLLSYYDLPSTLKKCFSYCAIFPKDYVIDKDKLIKLWMAQNYLRSKHSEDMELVGEQCFESLAMRSFFQDFERSNDGSIIRCKIHDIVHEFAQFLAINECFIVEVATNEEPQLEYSSFKMARHSMIKFKSYASFPRFVSDKLKLRSLLIDIGYVNKIDSTHVSTLFDELPCLRALDLSAFSLKRIPGGIEKLILLRYLDLSKTSIKELPEALCDLYNLQTLDLMGCKELQVLPEGIAKLLKLRHLINQDTYFMYLPKGVERLTCLRTLNTVVVGGDSKALTFECLKNLNHLQGSLDIDCLGSTGDVGKVNSAELKNKKNLIGLNLVFFDNHNEEALEAFQPPPNLERLMIENYHGNPMPLNWIGMVSLTKLKELRLICWMNCERLPPLGKLPFLETLIIEDFRNAKIVDNEFLGIESQSTSSSSPVVFFPRLHTLEFQFMDNWEEWTYRTTRSGGEDITIMPSLCSLKIWFCHKLKTLPDYLLQLKKLETLAAGGCPLLEKGYYLLMQQNWLENSGIPKIRICQQST